MTGIQASQAIEAYTLFVRHEGNATHDSAFGVSAHLGVYGAQPVQLPLTKGTVLIVRRAVMRKDGSVELSLISQDHLHQIAAELLAD